MSIGSRLSLRLVLEGCEIPVISASIQAQKNSAAVASIQIPFSDYALDLKPRTLVHLFQYDMYRGAAPEQQVFVGGAGINVKQQILQDPDKAGLIPPPTVPRSAAQSFSDLENENYKLIFGGEVVGVRYSKTPRSRSLVLQCVDWSSYWDIAYQYQISGMSLGGGGIKAAFTGASTTVFSNFLEGSGDIVAKLLETAPRSYPKLKGTLLGGIVHLIEAIGGCYFGKNAIKGSNDFFSLAEMKLHLTQMVGANVFGADDETNLLKRNGFGSMFSKALGGLGKLVTIRQVLLALQRYIFHEIVPITAPRFIPADVDPNTQQQELVPFSADRDTAPIAKTADTLKSAALELKSRQEKSTDAAAATRQSAARGGLKLELSTLATTAADAAQTAKRIGLQNGVWSPLGDLVGVQEVSRIMEAASRQFVNILNEGQLGTTGLYRFPLAGTGEAAAVSTALDGIVAEMTRAATAQYKRRVQRAVAQPDPPARLLTQIYRPDVWMVAPPRCNVLFPENYSQFDYGRDFQAEVTRLLLRTSEAFYGSDILFDGFYMSPSRLTGARTGKQIGSGRVGVDPPDLSDAPAWVVKDLMDHELYTGINPAFERMSDLNLHAIRGGSIEVDNVKIGYAQLACNHIFFQHRFKSRSLMVSGKFNPYFVLGFPAVVVDKYLAQDQLKDAGYDFNVAAALSTNLKRSDTPLPGAESQIIDEIAASGAIEALKDIVAARPNTHYLGTPALISHSVSATSGGSTQVQMDYARTTNEKTEFLGDNIGVAARSKRTRNVTVKTVVAGLEPPKTGTTGYVGGRIWTIQDVTDQYTKKAPKSKGRTATGAERFVTGTLLPLFVPTGVFSGRRRRGTRVPVGVEQSASAYGPEIVALVGSGGSSVAASAAEVLVTFRAYEIREEVGAYATEDVELPPETLTFPPWYGESYRSHKIGALYSYYFGVGSIADPTTILGASAPRTYGDGEVPLYLQFERTLGNVPEAGAVSRADQAPTPGLGTAPEAPGGGSIGPRADKGPTDALLGRVDARSSLKLAIDELVAAYSATRLQHFDTAQFVQNYTWRPIASMIDLLGTSDLSINELGGVDSGREGFHSRAFGDYDDLRLLVSGGEGPLPQQILGLATDPKELVDDESKSAKIAKSLDTRLEKRRAVQRYLAAIAAQRGVVLG